MSGLLLVGASRIACAVANVVRLAGSHELIGYLDDDASTHGTEMHGLTILGGIARVAEYPESRLVVCADISAARAGLVDRLAALGVADERYARVVHPSVDLPPDCQIGPGSVLLAQVTLTAEVSIGAHVVVMPGATLTHDDVVESCCTVGAGAAVGPAVRLRRCAELAMNSAVGEGLEVGERGSLGIGSALMDDLPAGQTWIGVPARPFRGGTAPM